MQKQRRRAAVKEAAKAEAEETDEVKEAKRLKAVAKQAKEAHKAAEKQVVATTMELNGIEAAVTAGTATPKDLSEAQANQKQVCLGVFYRPNGPYGSSQSANPQLLTIAMEYFETMLHMFVDA